MRTHGVVVPSPGFDYNLGLVERVEDLSVEQFVTQFSVKGFAGAILSGTARFDIGGLGSDGRNPFPKRGCYELRVVLYGPGRCALGRAEQQHSGIATYPLIIIALRK
jgi:hypothetical protein